ncbi:MAG: hypothetical protein AB8C95_02085, partial [Phycisphaeraceae bacterium]
MTTPLTPEQLDQWVLAYFDGELDAESFAQLTEALRTDPAALDRLVEFASMDRGMQDTLTQGEQVQAINQASHEHTDPALPFQVMAELLSRGSENAQLVTLHHALRPGQSAMPYLVGAGIAAVLVLAVTLTFMFSGGPTPSKPAALTQSTPRGSNLLTVATLTASHNAVWSGGPASAGLGVGDTLHPNQTLALTAGFAEITTAQGAIVILEAPATIELI